MLIHAPLFIPVILSKISVLSIPHHKHESDRVIASAEPSLNSILGEIEKLFLRFD